MTKVVTQGSDRDLVLISVFTFFTVGLWVFFEVLKTAKTTTVTAQTTQIVQPLDPKLDISTVDKIVSRKVY